MKTIIAWIKSVKYLAWGLLAVGVVVAIWLIRTLFSGPKPSGPARLPEVPPALQKKVEATEEAATKAKLEVKIKSDADRAELVRTMQIQDGAERRKRLAELLRRL